MEFLKFIIPTQIPVVLFLLMLCIQTYRILGIKEFKYISYAWAINLIYLCANLTFSLLNIYERAFSQVASTVLNGLSIYFFFLSIKLTVEYPFKFIRKFPNIIFILIFLIVGILKISSNNASATNFIYIRNIPDAFVNYLILHLLAQFFRKLTQKYKQSNLLYWGTLLYAFTQLLPVIKIDSFFQEIGITIYAIAFSIGLLSKVIILIGLSVLLISVGKEFVSKELASQKLDDIFGKTFHEITYPMIAMEKDINILLVNSGKHNKREVERIESNYYRLSAIISASMKMYENDIQALPNDNLNLVLGKDTIESMGVNTAIQIAIVSIKPLTNQRVEFDCDYGGRCYLKSNSNELVQIFINLFKNSYEAFNEGLGIIKIKTRTEETNEVGSKQIIIQIEDNGHGIDVEIMDKIFQTGFSTKKKVKGGYGLSIVKELVEKNMGTIKVDSPVQFDNANKKHGTRFTLTFPKSEFRF